MTVNDYANAAIKFSADTAEWSELPWRSWFTTSTLRDWEESCDNDGGGLDLSWAFHLSESEIRQRAPQEMMTRIADLVRLARDDEWEPEALNLILDLID